jgi:hypothetical protein
MQAYLHPCWWFDLETLLVIQTKMNKTPQVHNRLNNHSIILQPWNLQKPKDYTFVITIFHRNLKFYQY